MSVTWFQNRVTALQQAFCDKRPLLIVAGIDGKNNEGSQQLMKWLFLGQSGLALHNCTIYDDDLEDCLVVLTKNSITIFCNPHIHDRIAKLGSACENLKIICQNSAIFGQNSDDDEMFKIEAFVTLVQHTSEIIVPITTQSSEPMDHKEKMVIEKWPIVQAYALDEMSNHGFFTMRHKVYGITQANWDNLIGSVDAKQLYDLFAVSAPLLQRHWMTMVGQLDGWTAKRRAEASEAVVAEPITSFYTYSTLSLPVDFKAARIAASEKPKILMGSRMDTASCFTDMVSSRDKREESKNPDLHFIVEGQDPVTMMRVARTYFLTNGGSPSSKTMSLLNGSRYEDESVVEGYVADARLLFQLYRILVELCHEVVGSFGQPQGRRINNKHDLTMLLLPKLLELAEIKALPRSFIDEVKDNGGSAFDFHLSSVDAFGRRENGATHSSRIMYVCCAMAGIPSASGHILGGIKFGESFAFSEVPTVTSLQTQGLLTGNIPAFYSWPLVGEEATIAADTLPTLIDDMVQAKRSQSAQFPPLGEPLLDSSNEATSAPNPADAVNSGQFASFLTLQTMSASSRFSRTHTFETLLTGVDLVPRIEGRVTCLTKGLVISDSRYGPIIIDFAQNVLAVRYCDGNFDYSKTVKSTKVEQAVKPGIGTKKKQTRIVKSTQGEALIIFDIIASDYGVFKGLRLTKEAKAKGAFAQQKIALKFALVLKPDTDFRRELLRNVMPVWMKAFENIDIRFDQIDGDEIPSEFCSAYEKATPCLSVQPPVSYANAQDKHDAALKKIEVTPVSVTPSSRQFLLDYSILSSVPEDQLKQRLEELSATNVQKHASDGKAIPLLVLTGLPGSGKHDVADALAKHGTDGTQWHIVAGYDLDKGLSSTAKAIAGSSGDHRAVYASSGLETAVEIVNLVVGPAKAHGFDVVSVACVVDVSNVFISKSLSTTFPRFADQLVEGYADSVILRHTKDANDKVDQATRKLISNINPAIDYIALQGDRISHLELIAELNRFKSEEQAKLRIRSARNEADDNAAYSPAMFPCATFPFSRHNLTHFLGELFSGTVLAAAQGPADMRVIHVRGLLRFDGSNELHDVSASHGKVVVRSSTASSAYCTSAATYTANPAQLTPHITFYGACLDRSFLESKVLVRCLRKKMVEKTANCLSKPDLAAIRAKFLRDPPLPSGWYFNGQDYLDSAGKRSTYRPDMEELKEAWVAQHNSVNAKINGEIQAEHDCALKEWASSKPSASKASTPAPLAVNPQPPQQPPPSSATPRSGPRGSASKKSGSKKKKRNSKKKKKHGHNSHQQHGRKATGK